jgi:GNAT superfamily N-acetyltransferase
VTGQDWDAVAAVFATTGDSGHCWCQWFQQRTPQWRASRPAQRRADLESQARDGVRPPGVLAYVEGEPAGWCAVAPRASYPRLRAARKLATAGVPLDAVDAAAADAAAGPGPVGGVWAVTCFVVRSEYRRRGLSGPLLDGAVALAGASGADAVEGYPIDLARRGKTAYQELFVGTLSTFLAAGFVEVGRSAAARPVVRRRLEPPRS